MITCTTLIEWSLIFKRLWFSDPPGAQAVLTNITTKFGYVGSHSGTQSGLNIKNVDTTCSCLCNSSFFKKQKWPGPL